MNPILAEIFPVLLKKLPRQADFLDYKWFLHEIEDPYAYIADEPLFKLAHKRFNKCDRVKRYGFV
jgi:hypothetical protein